MTAVTSRRLHVPLALAEGVSLALPPGASRHAQVWRLQPGDALVLFDGSGSEWAATVERMGRTTVEVRIGTGRAVNRELPMRVTLAVGMPANERMDTLVEKATELGVAAIQPLQCERAVVRLSGERAERKVAHWQAVAVAAAEQSGRTVVPSIEPVAVLPAWLAALPAAGAPNAALRGVLSLRDARPLPAFPPGSDALFLSGPEGGLSDAEEALARAAGFAPVTLGARVLRADTAPLAALAFWGLRGG